MKKTSLYLGLFLLLLSLSARGQQYRTIELKPITQEGWKYYYDLKRVTSPVALEVPLLAVNDEEVTRYLKAYKGWNIASNLVTLVPLVYLLSLPKNGYIDQETFWWIFGSTVAAQLGMSAISHIKLGKSIDRYNMLILRPTGLNLGLSVTYKF